MNEVISYLKQLLSPNDSVVVATSGGPDSMCLLHLLCELKKEFAIQVIVAHVNHKLRLESEEEAEFVKSFATEHSFTYEYMEILEYKYDNLESEARQKRYAFFQELVEKYHAKYLFTAHHGDDLMETILMRLTRGSSIKGYCGFLKEVQMDHYMIVRPLITLTKKEICLYMEEHQYSYYIDKSNYSFEYTRNRYRAEVLPFFKNEYENVHLKFLEFSEKLSKANQFITSYVTQLIPSLKDEKGYCIQKLKELDAFILEKVIEYEFSLYYLNDLFLVSDKHKDAVIDIILGNKSNAIVNLPNGYLAIREYDYFRIMKQEEQIKYHYVFDSVLHLPSGIIKKVAFSDTNNNSIIRLNSQEITMPIIVRTREDGDKMVIKGNHTKKIKDILIDEKIPVRKRDVFPIVTDSENQILWLPGVKKSKFDVERDGIYDIILSYEEEKHE